MTAATTNDKWAQPQEVDPMAAGFGASRKELADLLPPMADIPEEFKKWPGTVWNRLQSRWFFKGIDARVLQVKFGVDRKLALLHLKAIQGTFDCGHEHKEAAVAWLMSRWFEETEYVKAEADKRD